MRSRLTPRELDRRISAIDVFAQVYLMLFVTLIFILIQFVLALADAPRFVYFSLWVQTIPYWWNFDVQITFDTPVGPLNLVAMQLFGFLLACLFVIVPQFDRAFAMAKIYRWHLLFLGFCLISLAYAPSPAYGFRTIAKLVAPLAFLIVVLTVIKSSEEFRKTRNAVLGSGAVILGLALFARAAGIDADPNASVTGFSGIGPPGMGPPVFCAHMLPVAMLALATYVCDPKLKNLVIALICAAAILAAVQRTSAGALFVGASAILFLSGVGIKRFILPISCIVGLPTLLLFSESFRRRMFFGNSSSDDLLMDPTKALGSVNGSGRFGLWDDVLTRFFYPHPIAGSGIGATQEYLYTRSTKGTHVVHSEYVRLLCEVGIVGLILFAIAAVSYLRRMQRYSAPSNDVSVRIPALAAFGSLVTYLVYFSTDNGIDYVSQFGIYVFALVAVAENAHRNALATSPVEASEAVPDAQPFPNLLR